MRHPQIILEKDGGRERFLKERMSFFRDKFSLEWLMKEKF